MGGTQKISLEFFDKSYVNIYGGKIFRLKNIHSTKEPSSEKNLSLSQSNTFWLKNFIDQKKSYTKIYFDQYFITRNFCTNNHCDLFVLQAFVLPTIFVPNFFLTTSFFLTKNVIDIFFCNQSFFRSLFWNFLDYGFL